MWKIWSIKTAIVIHEETSYVSGKQEYRIQLYYWFKARKTSLSLGGESELYRNSLFQDQSTLLSVQ
jgi:hypothetical protein